MSRNLYRPTGGRDIGTENLARLWALNLSDGQHPVLDIAERAGIPFAAVCATVELLSQNGLLSVLPEGADFAQSEP